MNLNLMRELFEAQVYPSFGNIAHGLRRKDNGEYVSGSLEDHWQTFQEGFELAYVECVKVLKKRFMGDLNREDMEVRRCVEAVNKHFGVEE